MNKSLAIVKARTVCGIYRPSGIQDWHVKCPSNLADMNSEPMHHVCPDGYNEASQWCAQAVARVALHLVMPNTLEGKFMRDVYWEMHKAQVRGEASSAQEILRVGLRYAEARLA